MTGNLPHLPQSGGGVAPQGFVAAGDGYNQRYDDLIDGVECKVKQVDDVALWDSDISEHWWRMLDYLEMVGNNGMVLNPEKFEFCQKEIEFAGFVVTETEVKPPQEDLGLHPGVPHTNQHLRCSVVVWPGEPGGPLCQAGRGHETIQRSVISQDTV